MQWRRAKAAARNCGSCGASIGKDDVYAVTRSNLVRCAACATSIEPQPDVIEDDPAPPVIGIQSQASMFETSVDVGLISAGELTRRRSANHLRNRQRGTR